MKHLTLYWGFLSCLCAGTVCAYDTVSPFAPVVTPPVLASRVNSSRNSTLENISSLTRPLDSQLYDNGSAKRRSRLHQEGQVFFGHLFRITRHASNGVYRAVNVTGSLAGAVAGSAFKLAGAAVVDAGSGLDSANSASPLPLVGVSAMAKGLTLAGEAIYSVGVKTENVTAVASAVAEDTLKFFVDGTIDNVEDTTMSLMGLDGAEGGYDQFGDIDRRIIDHVVHLVTPLLEDAMEEESLQGESNDPGHAAGDSVIRVRPTAKRKSLPRRIRNTIKRHMNNSRKPSIRFHNFLTCALAYGTRCLTTNPYYAVGMVVVTRLHFRLMEGIHSECIADRLLADIKFEAVNRLQAGTPERTRWLNNAAEVLWEPFFEPALSGLIADRVNIVMQRAMPTNTTWIGVNKLTLGRAAPRIRYMLLQSFSQMEARETSGTAVDNTVTTSMLQHQAKHNIPKSDFIYLEAGVDFRSERSKATIKIGLPKERHRRNWWSVSTYVPSYRIKIGDVRIQARVVMGFQLRREGAPFLRKLWLSFSEVPQVHFSVEAVTGLDIANIPILRRTLQHAVLRALAPLCQPHRVDPDILTRDEWETAMRHQGLHEVVLSDPTGMPPIGRREEQAKGLSA